MCLFDSLSGCELVTLANVVSLQLSQGLTPDEIAILGGFFNSLGDNLGIIAATQARNTSQNNPNVSCL